MLTIKEQFEIDSLTEDDLMDIEESYDISPPKTFIIGDHNNHHHQIDRLYHELEGSGVVVRTNITLEFEASVKIISDADLVWFVVPHNDVTNSLTQRLLEYCDNKQLLVFTDERL